MHLVFKRRFVTLLLLLPFAGFSQISDSLYQALPDTLKPKSKTLVTSAEKQKILRNAPDVFSNAFEEELVAMAMQLEKVATTTTNQNEKIEIEFRLGYYYGFIQNSDKAIHYFKAAVKDIGDSKQYNHTLASCYTYLGIQYFRISQNDDSTIAYLHKSLLVDGAKDSILLCQSYNLYAVIYRRLELYDSAIYYSDLMIKAIPYENIWEGGYTQTIIVKASCFLSYYDKVKRASYADSAEALLYKIISHKKNDAAAWYEQTYFNLGALYYAKGNYKKSLQLLDSASLPEYNKTAFYFANYDYKVSLYRALCMINMDNFARGKKILDSINLPDLKYRKYMFEALYRYAEKNKDWQSAFKYFKQYKQVADSFDVQGQKGKIFEATQKYSVSQKEAAIVKLENNNLKQQQQKKNIAFVAILCIAFLVMLMYWGNKKQQAKRKKEREALAENLLHLEEEMALERMQSQAKTVVAMADLKKNISQDMHDEVSSSIAGLKYFIADLRRNENDDRVKELLNEIEQETQGIYLQARDFMHGLYNNDISSQYNVCELLRNLSLRFDENTSLQISTSFDEGHINRYFTPLHHSEMYPVIKEAVANTMKHSGASKLNIEIIFKNGGFHFTIADNGRGFAENKNKGIGINSLHQRLAVLRGHIKLVNSNSGTVLSGSFPVAI